MRHAVMGRAVTGTSWW